MSILGKYSTYNTQPHVTSIPASAKVTEIKLVMIGDCSVGKTSLVTRLVFDRFKSDSSSTIGGAFNILTKEIDNNEYVKFQVWDTAGQDRFRSLVPMYVKNCKIVFIVFDITSMTSFISIKDYWYNFIVSIEPGAEIILIGNKSDLEEKRQVTTAEAQQYSYKIDVPYIECSSMSSSKIGDLESLMISTAQKIKNNKVPDIEDVYTDRIDISEKNTDSNKLGCHNFRCFG
jgi:Ras-related protein Rab-6A